MRGYNLEIKVFNDYVLFQTFALESNELDANYFQHEPYPLMSSIKAMGRTLSVLKDSFEPIGHLQRN